MPLIFEFVVRTRQTDRQTDTGKLWTMECTLNRLSADGTLQIIKMTLTSKFNYSNKVILISNSYSSKLQPFNY